MLDQTPLPVPQAPMPGLEAFSFCALLLELDEPERSLFCSVDPKPYDREGGNGEVVLLFKF